MKRNGKLRLFCDYAKVTSDDLNAPPVPTNAVPFVIGDNYRYCGYISCLRVVTKALTPGEMLFASDDPNCISDPMVAYWSMDGVPGEPMHQVDSTVTNDASQFSGQYFADANLIDCAARLKNAAAAPVATTATAFRKNAVFVGGAKLRENAGAATIGYDDEGKHSVFTLYPSNHIPVRSGSFTFETFYKFDKDAWTAHKTGSTYCPIVSKPALVASHGTSRGYDWWAGLWVYSTGSLQFNVATNGAVAMVLQSKAVYDPNVVDNRWHHFAVVYDEENLTAKLYWDYQEKVAFNLPAPMPRDVNPENDRLVIGDLSGATPFQGELDEIRYMRVALPVEQFLRAKSDRGVAIIFR